MPTLIEAMGQNLTALHFVPSLDYEPQTNVEILVAAAGSGRAAARALGVPESTLRGWRRGVKPRRSNAEFVAAARGAATARYRPGYYDSAYHGELTLVINGGIRVSRDFRVRTVHPGRNIPLRVMQGILRAWSRGDDSRAERLLYKAIDTYYQPLAFDNIFGVWFE